MDASEVAGVEERQRAEAARKIPDGIKVENAIIVARVSDGRYVGGRADTAENADADSVMAERMAKDIARVAEHAKSSAQESSDKQARQAKRDFEAGYDRTNENAA